MRVCETLYYHCQNDHRYITELRTALLEIGLDKSKVIQREYVLKDEFKDTELYKEGMIFLNDRVLKSRKEVHSLPATIRDNIYTFHASLGVSAVDVVFSDDDRKDVKSSQVLKSFTINEIADINYTIVYRALRKYPVYNFNALQSHFPNVKSVRQFVTDEKYLGSVKIDIYSKDDNPSIDIIYKAVFKTLGKIANAISDIEETYEGTTDFRPQSIGLLFHNKIVNYSDLHDGGGVFSQNDSTIKPEWRIDLSAEDWFVYTDNYGTSEEKAFVAFFKSYVDKLRQVYSRVCLIRNEREFHIYSFDDGSRFEPDYVLFLQKDNSDGFDQLQIFIEPKGDHLLDKDRWKEDFLLQMKSKANAVKLFKDDNNYIIWGLHFFNQSSRMSDFKNDIASIIGE